jgi:type II secretory pathway pseudopilin PulG
LVELLVVIAIIGILAALLLQALSDSKGNAKRTVCLSNLKQINYACRMYIDDSKDVAPVTKFPTIVYKELMKTYVGLKGRSSPQDMIFACPADTFFYHQIPKKGGFYFTNAPQHEYAKWDYSSYWFNGMNVPPLTNVDDFPSLGIAGLKIASIKEPAKTVLVVESPAFFPYSWHQPRLGAGWAFSDAKDMVSFVDGHASYIKMCLQDVPVYSLSCSVDPPVAYGYKWSGD